jgi:hypothetical protein
MRRRLFTTMTAAAIAGLTVAGIPSASATTHDLAAQHRATQQQAVPQYATAPYAGQRPAVQADGSRPTSTTDKAAPRHRITAIPDAEYRATHRSAKTLSGPSSTTSLRAGEWVLPTRYTGQPTSYTCGPTATHMALALRNASPGVWALASEQGTSPDYGTSASAVLSSLRRHSGAPYEAAYLYGEGGNAWENNLVFNRVAEDVDGGFAVVANVWAPAGAYPYGHNTSFVKHFFVVDGYDTNYGTVRISDPGAYYLGTPAQYWITKADLAYLVSGTPGGYMW